MPSSSYNCTLTFGGVAVGEVTSISLSGIQRAEIEVTSLTDATKEYIVGTTDPGTIECAINFTGQAAALDALEGPTATASAFTLDFGDAGTFSGNAYVTQLTIEAGLDAALTGSVTLRPTGTITYAA